MKIAAYVRDGVSNVGRVSADLQSVQAFAVPTEAAERGALVIVEALARGEKLPALLAPVPLSSVKLTAPIPRPRRNIFCVGKNYYAHAREFAGSGFDGSAKAGSDIPEVPIYFTKVPECVVGPTDFIFNIPTLIETLSAGITLYSGDIIATGTPAGLGIGFKPPKYLQHGDVVRQEIDGIGGIENPVRKRSRDSRRRLRQCGCATTARHCAAATRCRPRTAWGARCNNPARSSRRICAGTRVARRSLRPRR